MYSCLNLRFQNQKKVPIVAFPVLLVTPKACMCKPRFTNSKSIGGSIVKLTFTMTPNFFGY